MGHGVWGVGHGTWGVGRGGDPLYLGKECSECVLALCMVL